MAKASDNVFPKVITGMQTSDPAAPSDSSWKLYSKPGGIYARSSNGIVGPFGAGSTFSAAGSNSKDVSGRSYAGDSTILLAPFDHEHLGVSAITSSSSNTLARPIVNIRAGANVGLAASDSNGDGVFDTLTIVSTGGGSGSVASLASASYKRTAGDYTTTSSSFADIDGTNLNFTLVTGARRVMFTMSGSFEQSTATTTVAIDLLVDGSTVGGSGDGIWVWGEGFSTGFRHPLSICYITDILTAASHTFKPRFRNSGTGTFTIHGGSNAAFPPLKVAVVELLA